MAVDRRVGGWNPASHRSASGGRSWWAHFDFTPINIELTIHKKQVEELMNVKGIGEKSFLKLKPLITIAVDKGDRAGGQK